MLSYTNAWIEIICIKLLVYKGSIPKTVNIGYNGIEHL